MTTKPSAAPLKTALRGRRAPGKAPLKSALATRTTTSAPRPSQYDPELDRRAQLEMYTAHLDLPSRRRGRPYSANSVRCYLEAAHALNDYLNQVEFPSGLETVTYVELNAFNLAWHNAHSLGGIVTKQGNMRMLFEWISEEFDVDNAFKHRKHILYKRSQASPATLGDEFIDDILKGTAGRTFDELRDNAIIRLFLLGLRLGEMQALQVDDIELAGKEGARIYVRPFKYSEDYRVIPLPPSTVTVLGRYLRARQSLPLGPGPSGDLWISVKRKQQMTKSGIYQMLRRRAQECGYRPTDVHPHRFRHTAADKFLDGGEEGDSMVLFGWSDSSMPKMYGRSGAEDRAINAARRRGFGEHR